MIDGSKKCVHFVKVAFEFQSLHVFENRSNFSGVYWYIKINNPNNFWCLEKNLIKVFIHEFKINEYYNYLGFKRNWFESERSKTEGDNEQI